MTKPEIHPQGGSTTPPGDGGIKAHPEIKGMAWFSENANSIFASPEEEAAYIQMEKDLGGQPA